MTTRRRASITPVEATAARTARLPLSAKTTSVSAPAIAPSAPLREVVAISPPAITATLSHQANTNRPPRQAQAIANGADIASKAPRRLALPRFPSRLHPASRPRLPQEPNGGDEQPEVAEANGD